MKGDTRPSTSKGTPFSNIYSIITSEALIVSDETIDLKTGALKMVDTTLSVELGLKILGGN